MDMHERNELAVEIAHMVKSLSRLDRDDLVAAEVKRERDNTLRSIEAALVSIAILITILIITVVFA